MPKKKRKKKINNFPAVYICAPFEVQDREYIEGLHKAVVHYLHKGWTPVIAPQYLFECELYETIFNCHIANLIERCEKFAIISEQVTGLMLSEIQLAKQMDKHVVSNVFIRKEGSNETEEESREETKHIEIDRSPEDGSEDV